jgi:hypothetical protein
MFAMLPDKRALVSPTAIAYKLPSKKASKWQLFELEDAQNIGQAFDL